MKPMSLAEFRKTVKLKGQKSRLFSFKTEIFEAIGMSMSLAHIQGFLALHNIKISKQALHRWVLSQKTYQPKSEQKQSEYSHINVQEPKVELTTHLKVDDRASKVKAEIAKTDSKISLEGLPDGLFEYFAHTITK